MYLEYRAARYEKPHVTVRLHLTGDESSAMAMNHTLYSERENIWFLPSRQVPYINPPSCTVKRARGVDPQTFVRRLEDSSSRVRCLLDDEKRRGLPERELLLVYLALKYTLVHVIRRERVPRKERRERGGVEGRPRGGER